MKFGLFVTAATILQDVAGHGMLTKPRSRNWVARQSGQGEYCPHCYNGEGTGTVAKHTPGGRWTYPETTASSVRHGLCGNGSPLGGHKQTYMGSKYTKGSSEGNYKPGEVIDIEVVITAHHMGWMEFSLCDKSTLDDPNGPITQGCLNKIRLERAPGDPSISPIDPAHKDRFYLVPKCYNEGGGEQLMKMQYILPNIECEHCVLQWYWVTANTCVGPGYGDGIKELFPNDYSGTCSGDGGSSGWVPGGAIGDRMRECGKAYPEEFWNCADITISGKVSPTDPPTPNLRTRSPTLRRTEPPSKTDEPSETTKPTVEVTSAPGTCAGAWEQCGGETHKAGSPTCCVKGYICNKQSRWYHQCIPQETDTQEPSETAKPTVEVTSAPGTCAGAWEQCGGETHKAGSPTCCVEGYRCDEQSRWYHQCVPGQPETTEPTSEPPSSEPPSSEPPTSDDSDDNDDGDSGDDEVADLCAGIVEGCTSGGCLRKKCQSDDLCAVARVDKKLRCLPMANLSAKGLCSALNRSKNGATKNWCRTVDSCMLDQSKKKWRCVPKNA